jgi:hypothetical protein
VIYVYAIADRDAAAPAGPGLGGTLVERFKEGRLAAFVSHDPPGGTQPTEAALWQHEAVVEELMDAGAVLPMRFGSVVLGEGDLRELLASRAADFHRALARVRGRVELGVRALGRLPVPEPRAGESDGRRYLLDKLERRRDAAQIADQIHPSFDVLSVASSRRLLPSEHVLFAGAYLVEREQVGEFERRARCLDHERADLELVCTGPWPPYSFAGGEGK